MDEVSAECVFRCCAHRIYVLADVYLATRRYALRSRQMRIWRQRSPHLAATLTASGGTQIRIVQQGNAHLAGRGRRKEERKDDEREEVNQENRMGQHEDAQRKLQRRAALCYDNKNLMYNFKHEEL